MAAKKPQRGLQPDLFAPAKPVEKPAFEVAQAEFKDKLDSAAKGEPKALATLAQSAEKMVASALEPTVRPPEPKPLTKLGGEIFEALIALQVLTSYIRAKRPNAEFADWKPSFELRTLIQSRMGATSEVKDRALLQQEGVL